MSADSAFEHTVRSRVDHLGVDQSSEAEGFSTRVLLTARAPFTQGGDVNPKMYVVNRRESYSFTTEKSHSQPMFTIHREGSSSPQTRVLPSRIDCTDPHVVSSLGRRNR